MIQNGQGFWDDVTCDREWVSQGICRKPAKYSFCTKFTGTQDKCGSPYEYESGCLEKGCCWIPSSDLKGDCFYPGKKTIFHKQTFSKILKIVIVYFWILLKDNQLSCYEKNGFCDSVNSTSCPSENLNEDFCSHEDRACCLNGLPSTTTVTTSTTKRPTTQTSVENTSSQPDNTKPSSAWMPLPHSEIIFTVITFLI